LSDLAGKRIALLEARMSGELANLIRRHGGEPVSAPAVREVTREAGAEVVAFIDSLINRSATVIVLQTGVGVSGLLAEADKLGRKDELLAALKTLTIVCRGPKPTAVLSRHGLQPTLNAQSPFTTTELLAALSQLDLAGQTVAVLHYGERNQALAEALTSRGAQPQELVLYEWELPADTEPLKAIIGEIVAGQVDAVAFTSQVQARHLFQIAAELGREDDLRSALNAKTIVASVGPTCTAALHKLGVAPQVEPENPKMGAMVVALSQYFTR